MRRLDLNSFRVAPCFFFAAAVAVATGAEADVAVAVPCLAAWKWGKLWCMATPDSTLIQCESVPELPDSPQPKWNQKRLMNCFFERFVSAQPETRRVEPRNGASIAGPNLCDQRDFGKISVSHTGPYNLRAGKLLRTYPVSQ